MPKLRAACVCPNIFIIFSFGVEFDNNGVEVREKNKKNTYLNIRITLTCTCRYV